MSTEVKRNYLEIKNLEDLLEGQKPLNDCTVNKSEKNITGLIDCLGTTQCGIII